MAVTSNELEVIITSDNGKVLRHKRVTSLEEVFALHRVFPRSFLGVFALGEMWLWVPEMKDWAR